MSECVHCGATDEPAGGIVVAKPREGGDTTCNICLADHLRDVTVLSRREADVAALKLQGHRHESIADLLDLEKSTVDEYSRRMKEKVRKAHATTDELARFA